MRESAATSPSKWLFDVILFLPWIINGVQAIFRYFADASRAVLSSGAGAAAAHEGGGLVLPNAGRDAGCHSATHAVGPNSHYPDADLVVAGGSRIEHS